MAADVAYATDYPAAVRLHIGLASLVFSVNATLSTSLGENQRRLNLAASWNRHRLQGTDVCRMTGDDDSPLELSATQTTLAKNVELAGALANPDRRTEDRDGPAPQVPCYPSVPTADIARWRPLASIPIYRRCG